MKLRPEEITSILKQRIEQYDVETDLSEVGTVLQVGEGVLGQDFEPRPSPAVCSWCDYRLICPASEA